MHFKPLPVRLIMALLLCLRSAAPAYSEVVDDFAFFEEEAKVFSASRRAQPRKEAPASVEIITAEEIRNSGAVHLWDFLRFRAGLTVLDGRSGEGNRAIVSIRGFPAEFVDTLLVLVDGRSVYTGLSGGAVWEALPVQIQDIEKIEIVRGPNAALYGSNAGLGVINIITRKPLDEMSVGADGVVGTRGLLRHQHSLTRSQGRGAFRVSYAHKDEGERPSASGSTHSDFLSASKGNFTGTWTPTDRTSWEMYAGGIWDNLGVADDNLPNAQFLHHFEMLKLRHRLGDSSVMHAMLARRDDVRTYSDKAGGLLRVRELQYDGEAFHQFDWKDRPLQTTYGAGLRYNSVDSAQIFRGNPYQKNAVRRAFLRQGWRPSPSWALSAAGSFEDSDSGGVQPAYQTSISAFPSEHHTLRASYGYAPTIPTLYDRSANQAASPTILLVGNPQIKSQKIQNYEIGYLGEFFQRSFAFEANAFYMDINDLNRTIVKDYTFPILTLSFDNSNSAIARGMELKSSYRWDRESSMYINYTLESISDAKGDVNISKGTPGHLLNFGGVIGLPRGFAFGFNAGYKDAHTLYSQQTGSSADIAPYWRVDARISWNPPFCDNCETHVAVQNLLVPRHKEFAEGLLVPRTFSGGISARWGGK